MLVPLAVLATTALRFLTTGIYELSGSSVWQDVAGVTGLALCALAVYAAVAMALEGARRETVISVEMFILADERTDMTTFEEAGADG